MAVQVFEVDDVVEVIGSDEGLVGSYHSARIIEVLPLSGFYIIEYHHIYEATDTPLRETVLAGLLRLIPPRPMHRFYAIGEHVDLWARDGWWYGTVQSNPNFQRFEINFQAFDYDNVVAYYSDIRPHHEWVQGAWVQSNGEIIHID